MTSFGRTLYRKTSQGHLRLRKENVHFKIYLQKGPRDLDMIGLEVKQIITRKIEKESFRMRTKEGEDIKGREKKLDLVLVTLITILLIKRQHKKKKGKIIMDQTVETTK